MEEYFLKEMMSTLKKEKKRKHQQKLYLTVKHQKYSH